MAFFNFSIAPGARAGRLAKGPRSRWPKRLGKIWASWGCSDQSCYGKIRWKIHRKIHRTLQWCFEWENMGEIAIDCCWNSGENHPNKGGGCPASRLWWPKGNPEKSQAGQSKSTPWDDEYVNLKHVQMKIVSAMFACHMASVLGLTHEPQIISGSKAGHVSGGLIAGYRYYSPRA